MHTGTSQGIPSHAFKNITRHSQSFIEAVYKTFPDMHSVSSQHILSWIQAFKRTFPAIHSGILQDISSHASKQFPGWYCHASSQFTRHTQPSFQSCIQAMHTIFPVMYGILAFRRGSHHASGKFLKRTVAKSRKNLSWPGNHDKSLFCFICPGVQVLWRSLVFLCDLPQKHFLFLYV
jgi:hypothetical protein